MTCPRQNYIVKAVKKFPELPRPFPLYSIYIPRIPALAYKENQCISESERRAGGVGSTGGNFVGDAAPVYVRLLLYLGRGDSISRRAVLYRARDRGPSSIDPRGL